MTFVRWIGFAALLYVLSIVLFFASNIATILAIGGYTSLTQDVMWTIFLRDALMCIPIVILGTFLVPVFSRALEH